MKMHFKIIIGVLILFGMSALATAVPTIDGRLDDWGLAKLETNPWNDQNTWVASPGIQFIVEDNYDPRWADAFHPSGIHIKRFGSVVEIFEEPKVMVKRNAIITLEPEPVGGEEFDVEALYTTQTPDTLYVAIVTSLKPNGAANLRPGDLALDLDNNKATGEYGYEYGVKLSVLSPFSQGDIIKNPDWDGEGFIIPADADIIEGGTVVGHASVAYNNLYLPPDNGKDNFIVECAIPKAAVGKGGQNLDIRMTRIADNCLNDHIVVPEFPTIAVSISIIIGLLFVISRIRNEKQ